VAIQGVGYAGNFNQKPGPNVGQQHTTGQLFIAARKTHSLIVETRPVIRCDSRQGEFLLTAMFRPDFWDGINLRLPTACSQGGHMGHGLTRPSRTTSNHTRTIYPVSRMTISPEY
jgi:hypothetical protein